MANYPVSIDELTNPTGTDDVSVVDHADQHATANDILEALMAKVGADSSAETTSHDYKLSSITGSNKAAPLASPSFTGATTVTNTTDGASNQVAVFQGDRATPTDGDAIYQSFLLSDSGGTQTEFARITAAAVDVTDTTEDGSIIFGYIVAGTFANKVRMDGAAFYPFSNDLIALGAATVSWSDLFLASGAVINFNNGDVTLTHAANLLTFAGGVLDVPASGLSIASTAITASAAELNILDGATLTVTELNYVDGVTSAIQTQLDAKAADSAVVHDTGDETIAGVKTFSSDPIIPDEVYGAGWNGSLEPATKNAIYDKIEALVLGSGSGDVTGPASSTDNAVVRFDGTTGKAIQNSTVLISDNADITAYDPTNDGNPEIALGSSATDDLAIVAVYASGAQTLHRVDFITTESDGSADKGLFRFKPDGVAVLDIDDGGINFAASMGISINGTDILTDAAGTATLSNIDALDATTEATIEAAIDTLANLTSVQGRTVTLADAGFDVLFGWDDSGSAYKNFALADITTEAAPAAGDFLLAYTAEGALVKIDWSDLPSGSGDVSAAANITDNAIVRGDGGAKGVQSSATTMNDDGRLSTPNDVGGIEFGGGTGNTTILKTGSDGTFLFDAGADVDIKFKGTALGASDWGYTDDSFVYVFKSDSAGNTTQSGSATFGGALLLTTSDTGALGSATKMWSDLFLASGAVINFNNGDITLTHAANELTVAGGALTVSNQVTATDFLLSSGGSSTDPSIRTTGDPELGIYFTGTTLVGFAQGGNVMGTFNNSGFQIGASGARVTTILDEDSMASDSATSLATQQSIKAYADTKLALAGGTMTGAITLAENAYIALDPAGSADGKFTGTTISGTAGATLAFGDLIYLDPTDSRWELADANAAAGADGDARGILGICVLAAAADGDPTRILLHGVVRADAAFPALTINAPVYVSETAGDIVVTQPTTTDVVIRIVGFAITADEIFFNPAIDQMTHT